MAWHFRNFQKSVESHQKFVRTKHSEEKFKLLKKIKRTAKNLEIFTPNLKEN